jgi:hypothetical protein
MKIKESLERLEAENNQINYQSKKAMLGLA